ncbi:hypothetical protein CK223_31205 [Mesorhizobium loti]|nr:hypothetical protein CK223_31205 [Mesorhizobium loti]
MALLAAQPAHTASKLRFEPILPLARPCSRVTATLAGWMAGASMLRARSQRASQKPRGRPISDGDPLDSLPGLAGLVAPAQQQLQQ